MEGLLPKHDTSTLALIFLGSRDKTNVGSIVCNLSISHFENGKLQTSEDHQY